MFIFLLRQTVCPSAPIHAINWSLCSVLLEQGNRPRKGAVFHGSVILAAAHARRREHPKQVTGKLSSDSAEMARDWRFGARTRLLTTQGVSVSSYEKICFQKSLISGSSRLGSRT